MNSPNFKCHQKLTTENAHSRREKKLKNSAAFANPAAKKFKSKNYRRIADTVGACGAHLAEHDFITVGVCKQ